VVRIRSTNIMGGTTVQRGPRKPQRRPWQRDELPPSAEDGSSDR